MDENGTPMHPCARCATLQKTCCNGVPILVTQGDVARIATHTGRADFWESRHPTEWWAVEYVDDDPNWIRYTVGPDGRRRELKQQVNGDCTFLGAQGCTLPMEVRPVVCRIYPYTFNEREITGEMSAYCPESFTPPGSGLTMLTVLGMNKNDGERWRTLLYKDLREGTHCMRVGMTYDLKDDYLAAGYSAEAAAEFDKPETIEAMERLLRELGHEPVRIGNIRTLTSHLARGERWDLVWNIAEGLHGIGREAQVPALLDAYEIPYTFSDPLVLSVTLHKGMTKRIVRDLGVPTPDFFVVDREADIARVSLAFPLFVKPVAEGSSKGVSGKSLVRSREELEGQCRMLLETFKQPVLVETYLPGREFTVGIIGTGEDARVVGAMEVLLTEQAEAGIYSYGNKEEYEERVRYELVGGAVLEEATALALAAWRGLGCRDGGRIDVRADAAGRLSFIEVNPLPGLHPTRSDLTILCRLGGISYKELFSRILESASRRVVRGEFAALPAVADAAARKRVLILRDAIPDEAAADDDVFLQIDAIRASLEELGHTVEVAACTMDLSALRTRLARRRPDFVFNLVESMEGRGRLAHVVALLLEEFGVPYSGSPATALFTSSNKLVAKAMMRSAGIATPRWHTLEALQGGVRVAPARYILKSVWEHASIGLEKGSVIESSSAGELADALEHRWAALGGEGFAEEYIHGREIRVSMLAGREGPEVLPISEIVFEGAPPDEPHIDTHAAKWEETDSANYTVTVRRFEFAAADGALLAEVTRIAKAVWSLFELRGYARLDLRVDAQGRPWVIDVNANPSLSPYAGFAAALEEAKISYTHGVARMISHILAPVGMPAGIADGAPSSHTGSEFAGAIRFREEVQPSDLSTAREILESTGFFHGHEIDVAVELVRETLKVGPVEGYRFVFAEMDGRTVGYSCFWEIPCTVGSYDLYWIAVHQSQRGRGVGRAILSATEERIEAMGGRRVYAETSSRELYQPTRGFYERCGYRAEVRMEAFYGPADDKIVYMKVVGPGV